MGPESKQEVNRGVVKSSRSDHQGTSPIGPRVIPLSIVTGISPPAAALQPTRPAQTSPRLVLLTPLAAPSLRNRPAHVKSSPRADSLPTTSRPASDWAVRCENDQLAGASEASDCPSHFTSPARRVHAVVRPYLLLFVFALPFALDAGFAASGTRLQAPLIGSK